MKLTARGPKPPQVLIYMIDVFRDSVKAVCGQDGCGVIKWDNKGGMSIMFKMPVRIFWCFSGLFPIAFSIAMDKVFLLNPITAGLLALLLLGVMGVVGLVFLETLKNLLDKAGLDQLVFSAKWGVRVHTAVAFFFMEQAVAGLYGWPGSVLRPPMAIVGGSVTALLLIQLELAYHRFNRLANNVARPEC